MDLTPHHKCNVKYLYFTCKINYIIGQLKDIFVAKYNVKMICKDKRCLLLVPFSTRRMYKTLLYVLCVVLKIKKDIDVSRTRPCQDMTRC